MHVQKIAAFLENHHGRVRWLAMATVMIAGAAFAAHLGSKLSYADEDHYYRLAKQLALHQSFSFDGVTPEIYRPPGYPLLLALFLKCGAGIFVLRMLNFAALAGCLYLLHETLWRLGSRLGASLAVLLVMAYPVQFYTASTLYPQTICSFLLLLALALLIRPDLRFGRSFLIGAIFGYSILIAPNMVFSLIITALWLTFTAGKRWVHGLLLIGAALLVVAPWMVRNYRAYHRLLFVSANSGVMLLYGNSEHAAPNAGPSADIKRYYAKAHLMNEVQRDDYYRASALQWIKTHKEQAVKLYLLKVVNYFNYRNDLSTVSESSLGRDLIMLCTYFPLLFLSTWYVVRRYGRLTDFEKLLVMIYLLTALTTAAFFPRIRYRLPYDFLLTILAARCLQLWLQRKLAGKDQKEPVAAPA